MIHICWKFPPIHLSFFCFLIGCAQVQTLEGGKIDEQAPIPIAINPPNQTTQFNGQQIRITFDEFVRLNKPLQTISVIPNDINIKTELHHKTLTLSWEEPLRENTTYSIFLNRTVQDITESNDSIMQLVFSTGNVIDSLSYTTFVVNAENETPEKNIVVGLFDHPDSLRPIYFAQTDEHGKATLNHLKEGDYYVRAFSDDLKQGKIGKNDRIAFKTESIRSSSTPIDSTPLRLFPPISPPKITSFVYHPPGFFVVSANRSLSDTSTILSINEEQIPHERLHIFSADSIGIPFRPVDTNVIILKIKNEDWTDSTRLRIPTNQRTKHTKIYAQKTNLLSKESIVLSTTDLIDQIDTSQIKIIHVSDSSQVHNYRYQISNNSVQFWIDHKENERTKINVSPDAFHISKDWKTEPYEQVFTHRSHKELGVLNLTVERITTSAIIVEMLFNNTLVHRTSSLDTNKILHFVFNDLEPGEYTFRIIEDTNGNKQWDTGNFETMTQPETIHFFSTPITIRANWEIEATLTIDLTPSKAMHASFFKLHA